eukprot:scaffold482_cov266-Amphora_coffeaeformis.AAC.22
MTIESKLFMMMDGPEENVTGGIVRSRRFQFDTARRHNSFRLSLLQNNANKHRSCISMKKCHCESIIGGSQ